MGRLGESPFHGAHTVLASTAALALVFASCTDGATGSGDEGRSGEPTEPTTTEIADPAGPADAPRTSASTTPAIATTTTTIAKSGERGADRGRSGRGAGDARGSRRARAETVTELTVPATVDASENVPFTLDGVIVAIDPSNGYTVDIDWGDGTTDTLAGDDTPTDEFDPGPDTVWFGIEHTYPDDDPTATSRDQYPVEVTITDGDGHSAMSGVTATVHNSPPDPAATATAIGDGTIVIDGDLGEPSPHDTVDVRVEWGDGTVLDESFGARPVGDQGYRFEHRYGRAGASTIQLTATDDDGGTSTVVIPVVVEIGALRITTIRGDEVDENGVATVSGTFTDPSPRGAYTVGIDWGAGTVVEYEYPAGSTGFTETRRYRDDHPSRSPADDRPVTVTVTDAIGRSHSAVTTVTVRNVAPSITATGDEVPEGTAATVAGTIDDPGTRDTFTVAVDWGDGSPVRRRNLPAGTTDFARNHRYAAVGTYAVDITVTDDDGGSVSTTATVEVANVPPAITSLTGDVVDEGGTATVQGTFTGAGKRDRLTVTIDWGEGPRVDYAYPAGSGGFTETHRYLDDPSNRRRDGYRVLVSVTDDDRASDARATEVTVGNVAPTITSITGDTIDEDGRATVTGTFVDPGRRDDFTLRIDWGEGSLVDYEYPAGSTGFTETHRYLDDRSNGGTDGYTVTVTVTDDDGGSDTETVTVDAVVPVTVIDAVTDQLGNHVGAATWPAIAGLDLHLTGHTTGVGAGDARTAHVDWGDTTVDEVVADPHLSAAHAYEQAGIYEVRVSLDDDSRRTAAPVEIEVLDACGIARWVSARLDAQIALVTTVPEVDDALRSIIGGLVGGNDGSTPDGACGHLATGDTDAATAELRRAADLLLDAHALDANVDGPMTVGLLLLAAESVATNLVRNG